MLVGAHGCLVKSTTQSTAEYTLRDRQDPPVYRAPGHATHFHLRTLRPFNVFILLNSWICLHVLD